MDDAKAQLLERLKTANTVLVTVSRNPSVDQLAACIGLTLVINKLNKHASAVFSGTIPSTIEFLKPEQTIEKTTDSLRDFIIALDKNKADKLRYKVEDDQVKIFITPYKVSLSQSDLEFSQGDLNVELVVAIGVQKQDDLDQAIVAHGRILHDATVACINTVNVGNIGTINWLEPTASSLCELVCDLAFSLGDKLVDEQIATALLTGIIAETERFSNQKTSSQVMSISGRLMGAGANQQLVTNELSIQAAVSTNTGSRETAAGDLVSNDGTLSINHKDEPVQPEPQVPNQPPIAVANEPQFPNEIPQVAEIKEVKDESVSAAPANPNPPRLVTEPPALGGTLTSNSSASYYDPSTDPLSNITLPSDDDPIRSKAPNLVKPPETDQVDSLPTTPAPYTPPPADWQPPTTPAAPPPEPVKPQAPQTLSDLEQEVGSPHINEQDTALKESRDKIDNILSDQAKDKPAEEPKPEEKAEEVKTDASNTTGLDPSLFSEPPSENDADAAPPVPPPLPPITP